MPSPSTEIRARLRDWAASRGVAIDAAGYTAALEDNLLQPMSPATRADFEAGDGAELGSDGRRGKMQALHSSSALACNVFDYWRDRDRSGLSAALGTESDIVGIEFERKFATGLPGNSPNLDVVLALANSSTIAIESKFLEPYGAHPAPGFKPKYFEASSGLWASRGLPAAQLLAEDLQYGRVHYRWLYAEQLLKHLLGLATSATDWSLWYLWYQAPGPAGVEHALEAQDFASRVNADGAGFRSMSYQDLHGSLGETCGNEHRGYLDYLGDRYFACART